MLWRSVLILAVGLGAGVLIQHFSSTEKSQTVTKDPESKTEPGVITLERATQSASGIVVEAIYPTPIIHRTWRTGRIAFHEDRVAHLCPPTEGILREVPVRIGQSVQAGDVLAILESRELAQAKLEAYKAIIALNAEQELAARTKTTMSNAEELLKLLSAETPLAEIEKQMADKPIGDWRQQLLGAYSRWKQLKAQTASQRVAMGAVAESTLRKTEAEAEAAGAAYTALVEELRFQVKNQVRQAELKLKDAETILDIAQSKLLLLGLSKSEIQQLNPIQEGAAMSHLLVRAPFSGTIVEKHAVRSERVDPHHQLFVLADLSRLWVQADIFEADLPKIRELKESSVLFRSAVAGIPERVATIISPGHLIEKSSRSAILTAEADNEDRVLKPGLFVEVGLDTGDRTPVMQVPNTAIILEETQPFVFVQVGEEKFRRVNITTGRVLTDKVVVSAGLKPGDKVVVQGGFVLKSELFKDQMVGE
jgi:RND family efflux transporter MFP subunit